MEDSTLLLKVMNKSCVVKVIEDSTVYLVEISYIDFQYVVNVIEHSLPLF